MSHLFYLLILEKVNQRRGNEQLWLPVLLGGQSETFSEELYLFSQELQCLFLKNKSKQLIEDSVIPNIKFELDSLEHRMW